MEEYLQDMHSQIFSSAGYNIAVHANLEKKNHDIYDQVGVILGNKVQCLVDLAENPSRGI